MIIVRRCPPNVNKVQRNIRTIGSFTMSTPLPTTTGAVRGSSVTGTTISTTGGDQIQSFDWGSVISAENKASTIQMLTVDRENCPFTFPDDDPNYRKAAVLIPLCYDIKGRPSLLYNLRSSKLNKHKGEISFPGGAMDPEDKDDPVVAALRETHEELGIVSEDIEVWTTVRVFPTISAQMSVIPVMGLFKNGPVDPTKLKINPDEVDHAFTVTLEHLCDPRNWEDNKGGSKFRGRNFVMPLWKNLKVFNGTEEINLWGLTAFVTHVALSALLPSEVYTREVVDLPLGFQKKGSSRMSCSTSNSKASGSSNQPNSNL